MLTYLLIHLLTYLHTNLWWWRGWDDNDDDDEDNDDDDDEDDDVDNDDDDDGDDDDDDVGNNDDDYDNDDDDDDDDDDDADDDDDVDCLAFPCNANWTTKPGRFALGGNIDTSSSTVDSCKASCENNIQCLAVDVYNNTNSNGILCLIHILATDLASFFSSQDATHYGLIKRCPPSCKITLHYICNNIITVYM